MTAGAIRSIDSGSRLVSLLVALQVLVAPGFALAQDDDLASEAAAATDVDEVDEEAYEVDLYQIGASTLDVAVLRPLGGVTLLGGLAFFVASVPFVAPMEDGIGATWDIFVYSSYDYAVLRPLGELF